MKAQLKSVLLVAGALAACETPQETTNQEILEFVAEKTGFELYPLPETKYAEALIPGAAYDFRTNVVWEREPGLNSPGYRALRAHEYTHYLWDMNGFPLKYCASMERHALWVQHEWMKVHMSNPPTKARMKEIGDKHIKEFCK